MVKFTVIWPMNYMTLKYSTFMDIFFYILLKKFDTFSCHCKIFFSFFPYFASTYFTIKFHSDSKSTDIWQNSAIIWSLCSNLYSFDKFCECMNNCHQARSHHSKSEFIYLNHFSRGKRQGNFQSKTVCSIAKFWTFFFGLNWPLKIQQ